MNKVPIFIVLLTFALWLVHWWRADDSRQQENVTQETKSSVPQCLVEDPCHNPPMSKSNESLIPIDTSESKPATLQIEMPSAQVNVVADIVGKADSEKDKRGPRWPKDVAQFEIREGKYAVAHGDVILGVIDPEQNLGEDGRGYARIPRVRLWREVIPVHIDTGVSQSLIQEVIATIESASGFRFKPYENEKDFLYVRISNEICAAQLGKQGGGQWIWISPYCGFGEVLHEFMHSLGFIHEQSRPDRDNYVEVLWPNIQPEFIGQFTEISQEAVPHYKGEAFAFDPTSIMMYQDHAFAIESHLKTLVLKPLDQRQIQPTKSGLSQKDGLRLQAISPF